MELLLIIVLISILALLSYPRLIGFIDKANDTNIITASGTFQNLMNMYYEENNKYRETSSQNKFKDLIENKLNEYGEISSIKRFLDSNTYIVDNSSNPKTYKLKLISSFTKKVYIITPKGINTSE